MEISANNVWLVIMEIMENVEIDGDRVPERSIEYIKQKERESRDSEDFKRLVKNINSIKKEFEDVRDIIKYGNSTLMELLEQISATQVKAAEIINNRNRNISEEKQIEIKTLMSELDGLKKNLASERGEDILVISIAGAAYREGASKHQMLKNIIDQIS
jgi:hypothetical protein